MVVLLLLTAATAALRGLWSPCGLSMLSSINPVSEQARGHRFWVTACWYVAGAAAGGALLGAGCALGAAALGHFAVPADTRWALALIAALIAVVSDSRITSWSLPTHPRQVDERWLTAYRRWIYAGGYGVQIGTGFATYIMSAAVYLTAALAVLTANPAEALLGGVSFGVLRGLGITVAAAARDPRSLRVLVARIDAWAPASALVASAVEILAAAVCTAVLAGPFAAVAAAALLSALAYSMARGRRPHRDVGRVVHPLGNTAAESASTSLVGRAQSGTVTRS